MKRLVLLFLLISSMNSSFGQTQDFDLEGHRGARGLLPENSIPAFKKALELGVKTLEMDVVITADGKVVVSHDPYFSSEICLNELGRNIPKEEERSLNIYKMDYEDVKLFDCGSIGNKQFPEQKPMEVYKPLLTQVIDSCEQYAERLGREKPQYNIELKSDEKLYGKYQPYPDDFVRKVFNALFGRLHKDRVIIQSFDVNILNSWREHYYGYRLAFLVGDSKSWKKNIERLGFTPQIYSPNYNLLSNHRVKKLHEEGMQVVPWTVNEIKDMEKMMKWEVDGLITDYPNRFVEHFGYKTP